MNLLRKLLGSRPPRDMLLSPEEAADRNKNPVVAARFSDRSDGPQGVSSAYEGEQARIELERFWAEFYFQPERNFLEFLKSNGVTRMIAWFDWRNPEPEPKALIRLVLEMLRRGENFWDQMGISMFIEGRWKQGGCSSEESQEALSVLAQITGQPIKLYYKESSEKPDTEMMVMVFEP